jgi:hypothetical protein
LLPLISVPLAIGVCTLISFGSPWLATTSKAKVYNPSKDPSQASAELNQLGNMHLSGNKPRSTAVWIGATHHAIQENETWPIMTGPSCWAKRTSIAGVC